MEPRKAEGSGKIVGRLDTEIFAEASVTAARMGITLAEMLRRMHTEYLSTYKAAALAAKQRRESLPHGVTPEEAELAMYDLLHELNRGRQLTLRVAEMFTARSKALLWLLQSVWPNDDETVDVSIPPGISRLWMHGKGQVVFLADNDLYADLMEAADVANENVADLLRDTVAAMVPTYKRKLDKGASITPEELATAAAAVSKTIKRGGTLYLRAESMRAAEGRAVMELLRSVWREEPTAADKKLRNMIGEVEIKPETADAQAPGRTIRPRRRRRA